MEEHFTAPPAGRTGLPRGTESGDLDDDDDDDLNKADSTIMGRSRTRGCLSVLIG